MAEMSASDVALLSRDGNMWGGEGGAFFWIFALLILAGGGMGFGNNRSDVATRADVANQGLQNQLQQLSVETANNNYETALLINNQTNQMLQQNNTNLINAIQGFNSVNQNIAALSQQIGQLGYHMDQCCCEIKTQMLQNRLDDANAALVAAQNTISNGNQSQYILSQLGRFVAWTPSGTQAATGT